MVMQYDNLLYIDDMREDDLKEVINIRNHIDTLKYLHTPVEFNLDQSIKWFYSNKPIWFCIKDSITKNVIGYFRTSDLDYENKSLYVGCDIHPLYRGKGIALWGYKKIFNMLKFRGWDSIFLKVLKTNYRARNLYLKLGFKDVDKDSSSFIMGIKIGDNDLKKSVKIISCYLGNRRVGNFKPKNVFDMLNILWEQEQKIDKGINADTLLIYNKILDKDLTSILDMNNYKKCEEFLYNLDGKKTKNGHLFVIDRENIGISFGAFDFAFDRFKDKYYYWMFIEDDNIIIKNNVMKTCVEQLMNPIHFNKQCGFVATVGVNTCSTYPPHAHGGCGCTNRGILNEVINNSDNYSNMLKRGCLPHLHSSFASMGEHQEKGEIEFTNSIFKLDYELKNIKMDDIIFNWGSEWKRNDRIVPFSDVVFVKNKLDIDVVFDIYANDHGEICPKMFFYSSKEYEYKKLDIVFKNSLNGDVIYNNTWEVGDLSQRSIYWVALCVKVNEINGILVEIFQNGNLVSKFEYFYNYAG